jgi:HAD superfamily hydrolase (TIGR01509 family)
MIKLIIFDLDGVLCDTPEMHFETFSQAYKFCTNICITKKEHDVDFNGKSTKTKLEILKKRDNLEEFVCEQIWKLKQSLTKQFIEKYVTKDQTKIDLLHNLKNQGFLLACASNAIKKTVLSILENVGILDFFDIILSNEDVKNPKPSAEIYLKAMIELNCNPSNTLIIEDSKVGYEGACSTRAEVFRVVNSLEVNSKNIQNYLKQIKKKTITQKYKDEKLTVIIPMAVDETSFEKAGFTFLKPLIELNEKTIIECVIESLNIEANYIFIAKRSHNEKYNLENYLKKIVPNCKVVFVDELTNEAVEAVLLTKDYINNNPILIANSDQWIKWDVFDFIKNNIEKKLDASILTFTSERPKWSFVKINENLLVTEVAEKNPISDIAMVGIYWWADGNNFIKYANRMISKNIILDNKYYVCHVFNEAINDNKKIGIFFVEEMRRLGNPEELENFKKDKNI